MPAIGLLLLVVVAGVVVAMMRRPADARPRGEPDSGALPPPSGWPRPVEQSLDRWVGAGLLSDAQRTAILAHERAQVTAAVPVVPVSKPRAGRVPAVAEALGYLGGMLAVIGLLLIVSRYWPDMAAAGRLVLSAAATAGLLLAGWAVPEHQDEALTRLRGFLWLGGTATAAIFAGVVTADGMDAAPETIALGCAATVAGLSAVLWWGHDRPLQELTTLAGATVATGALVAEMAGEGVVGLAVWVAGGVLVVVGLRRVLITPLIPEALGAVAVLVGAAMVASYWQAPGLLLLLATALGLLGIVVVDHLAPEHGDRVLFSIVGSVALLQAVPGVLGYFAQDAAGITGLATWAGGAALLALGARQLVRAPVMVELVGGAALLGGAALTGVQWEGFAPLFGAATAIGLVVLGMLPGQVLLSVFGSVGLLINVPWAISWFFPGEGRAPLLIMVSGGLIIVVAILLTRMGDRFRRDLGPLRRHGPPPGAPA